jgi:hypothetical protein
MNPMDMKSKVLKEIMSLMDEEDGKKLMNHPKILAAKVTVSKPMDKMPLEDEAEADVPKLDEGAEAPEEPEGLADVLEDIMELKSLPSELKAKLAKFLK